MDKKRKTYEVLIVFEFGVLLVHRREQDLEGVYQIAEDDDSPLFPLILGEAASVDDAHLLEHSGLAALTSTWES